MDIKPIETQYKGYRFRSRLEARYAVFFDVLRLNWKYEAEGYTLQDGTNYLPDFWLPIIYNHQDEGFFIEIKANRPTDEESNKLKLLAKGTGHSACCFWNMKVDTWSASIHQASLDGNCYITNGHYDESMAGIIEVTPRDTLYFPVPFGYHFICHPQYYRVELIREALIAARSARFEFGESG